MECDRFSRQRIQPVHFAGHDGIGDPVDLAVLESESHCRGVVDDPVDDLLNGRLFTPVVFPALKNDVASLDPFHELVWTGSNGLQVIGVREVVGSLPICFFHDVTASRADPVVGIQELGIRLRETEHDRVVVRGVDGCNGRDQAAVGNVDEGGVNLKHAELNVL